MRPVVTVSKSKKLSRETVDGVFVRTWLRLSGTETRRMDDSEHFRSLHKRFEFSASSLQFLVESLRVPSQHPVLFILIACQGTIAAMRKLGMAIVAETQVDDQHFERQGVRLLLADVKDL